MFNKDIQRKLKAVLSADVKGYGKLMGDDDEATVNTITAYRKIITAFIQKYQGRVVDTPGDNILAEFDSALNAVTSAIEIQRVLEIENEKLPDNRRMDFRIGINLGDVIHKDNRIYGNGVNIAARIESLSEPGGVCISRGVYDQVKNHIEEKFEYLGEHQVKNIAEPVRIYRVLFSRDLSSHVDTNQKHKTNKVHVPVVMLVVLVVAACVMVYFMAATRPWNSNSSPIHNERVGLFDKPSIAVLPFKNLSGDPQQEYFSDGMTNDVITDLSKFRELYVIASNTVFTYKGKPVKVEAVGQDLGVQYVLEGSVQRIEDRLRINSQLINAKTGHHLWAERYDKKYEDLFNLQSDIVQAIVAKLAVRIEDSERERAVRKSTDNLKAYDLLLRGQEQVYQNTRKANREARLMFERAIEVDPRYAKAYADLAWTYINDFLYGWSVFPNKSLQQAHNIAKEALRFDESNARAHSALGYVYVRRAQYDLALSELQHTLDLNPNDSQSQYVLGSVLLYSGMKDEAIHWKEKALRLNPKSGLAIFMTLSQAYYLNERYDDAIRLSKQGTERRPDFVGNYMVLAAACAQVGLNEEAKRAAATVLELNPFFETDSYGTIFRNPEDRAKLIDGLKKAGLK